MSSHHGSRGIYNGVPFDLKVTYQDAPLYGSNVLRPTTFMRHKETVVVHSPKKAGTRSEFEKSRQIHVRTLRSVKTVSALSGL